MQVTVDNALIARASKLSGEDDATKVVATALEEMIHRRAKLEALLDLVGNVEFYPGYDHKALREGKHDGPD